jgi:hypothetical protein
MKFEIIELNARPESYHSRKGEPHRYKDKMYIWPQGESVLENLFNRHDRPTKIWKEEIIPAILEKIRIEHPSVYEYVKDEKWGWRQRCGCSCPCSPGFVGTKDNCYSISATVKFS